MFLADELVEGARPHPSGEGSGSDDAFLDFVFSFLKQILHGVKNTERELPRIRILSEQDYRGFWGLNEGVSSDSCSSRKSCLHS